MIPVKGKQKELTYLLFCLGVFVVDLIWFLLPKDG